MITSAQLQNCGVPRSSADAWAGPLSSASSEFSIGAGLETAHWIAQMMEESGLFTVFEENLNYRVDVLMKMWPAKFPRAVAYRVGMIAGSQKADQRAIANIAYGGRYGNGPAESGDGWKYRGRGPKQITFKDNYRDCGVKLGLDLVGNPELLLVAANGARSAAWYWSSRSCKVRALADDVTGVTRLINGGENGLANRIRYTATCKKVFS